MKARFEEKRKKKKKKMARRTQKGIFQWPEKSLTPSQHPPPTQTDMTTSWCWVDQCWQPEISSRINSLTKEVKKILLHKPNGRGRASFTASNDHQDNIPGSWERACERAERKGGEPERKDRLVKSQKGQKNEEQSNQKNHAQQPQKESHQENRRVKLQMGRGR